MTNEGTFERGNDSREIHSFTHNERVAKEKEDINTGLQHPHLGHHYHLRKIYNWNGTNFQGMHPTIPITEVNCAHKIGTVEKSPLRK